MLLLAPLALAGPYPEANPGRPSFSDNASPIETGALEIEAGAAADPEGAGLNYVLKFGAAEDADIRLGFDHAVYPGAAPGAASLMLKYTLKHPEDRVSGVAIAPFAGWDFEADQPGYGVYVIGSLPVSRVQLDANVLLEGAFTAERSVTLDADPVLTLGVSLTEMLSIYAESYAIIPVTPSERALGVAVAAGLGLRLRPNLVLDLGCDVGLLELPPWTAQLGFTYAGYVLDTRPVKTPPPDRRAPR